MATPGYNSGSKPGRPPAGKNGPNDKGGGTKTFRPPMPKPNAPKQGGSGK